MRPRSIRTRHARTIAAAGMSLAVLAVLLGGSRSFLLAEQSGVAPQEEELVKAVYDAREQYQASLERLRSYYLQRNHDENRAWVEKELTDYHLIVKHPYVLELDLPSKNLKPNEPNPKANALLREALGWLNRPSVTERASNYKRAEILLQRLIRDYPQSDRLNEACYYLGEIYASRYFGQTKRAVGYFERVFHYEPNTNLDARLRAAMLHDRELNDQRRAVELYQEILRREIDPNQTREARRRLDELLSRRSPR